MLPSCHLRCSTGYMSGPGQLSRYSDSLRFGRSGDRIPVWARFSAPVQTGPGAYPASFTMGTGSFPGVKRPGRGADHPPPSKCRGQERVGLYLYTPLGLHGLLWDHFYWIYERILVEVVCNVRVTHGSPIRI